MKLSIFFPLAVALLSTVVLGAPITSPALGVPVVPLLGVPVSPVSLAPKHQINDVQQDSNDAKNRIHDAHKKAEEAGKKAEEAQKRAMDAKVNVINAFKWDADPQEWLNLALKEAKDAQRWLDVANEELEKAKRLSELWNGGKSLLEQVIHSNVEPAKVFVGMPKSLAARKPSLFAKISAALRKLGA